MRNKKKSLLNIMKQKCAKKVRICTAKFCAVGCLVENYNDEFIVCLENADVSFNDGCNETEHRDSICICDDHIIAFEAISE
ncbi:MAG: hypothetical protein LUH11_00525 [Candidatus Gastranaerophilales bacterium]|nr:hypothetical protein [Candidatus Gastranaerophilales bacterium]